MGHRRLPIGAEITPGEGVHFRLWAPAHERVDVVLEDGARRAIVPLEREAGGYWSGRVADAGVGTRYRFRLGGDDGAVFPDPASRWQPEGVHGPSEVVDPGRFAWRHTGFPGVPDRQVVYELHLGTFTREGTYAAAIAELPRLAELGVTTLELMPVHAFPGTFGWGYDGVAMFAPYRGYGTPDELRAFVDAAHGLRLAVILDVVYNHLGPDGNYLPTFAPRYFSGDKTEWGEAINFDGPDAAPVRELFVENAGYWISEYRFDGLRFDATQAIRDRSKDHVLAAMARRAREAANGRRVFLVAENEPQEPQIARPVERGGHGLDALWNDDFHHAARVAATGRREAYFTDYRGSPQELVSAVKWGYLFQGQRYAWQKQPRGQRALDLPASAFVSYLQNHDQIANSSRGLRLDQLTSPGRLRALTALLLLAPAIPMLFQGQEWASSAPFLYFADANEELAPLVTKGRAEFVSQFPSAAASDMRGLLAAPCDRATFERCKLDSRERLEPRHATVYAMHRDLLALRASDAAFRRGDASRVHGAVLGPEAFVLRFFGDDPLDDRLLVVNLGVDVAHPSASEPLLAPVDADRPWGTLWSSEHPRYGGAGTPPLDVDGALCVPGHASFALAPAPTEAEGGGS